MPHPIDPIGLGETVLGLLRTPVHSRVTGRHYSCRPLALATVSCCSGRHATRPLPCSRSVLRIVANAYPASASAPRRYVEASLVLGFRLSHHSSPVREAAAVGTYDGSWSELNVYIPILVLGAIAAAFALGSVAIAQIAGPSRYNRAKLEAYECGIEPTDEPVSGPHAARAAVSRQVLPDRDAVHRLRHRDRVPLPVGGQLRRSSGRSRWSRW